MGSAQSYLSSEIAGTALTALIVAGVIGIGYIHIGDSASDINSSKQEGAALKKSKKNRQGKLASSEVASADITELPATVPQAIPGQFDVPPLHVTQDSSAAENLVPRAKKSKRKKTKTSEDILSVPPDYHSESSIQVLPKSRNSKRSSQGTQTPKLATADSAIAASKSLQLSTASLDTDSSWTQVGSRRGRKPNAISPQHDLQANASVTPSQTDDSSPVRNMTEEDAHDSFLLQQATMPSSSQDYGLENRKTLAEKLLPKPRKTGVEDMLETPDHQSISRVMRVMPLPNEKPAAGFSWADYEDVRLTTDGGENDADGEDDGWGVVTSKRPTRSQATSSTSASYPLKAPETLTKRQRQNAQKREVQKVAKADAEAQRLSTLANHRRELEKVRMKEQSGKGSKAASGGMKATVDGQGKLVWE